MMHRIEKYIRGGLIFCLWLFCLACTHQQEGSARKLWMQANMASFERQYEDALDLLQDATDQDPDFADAWLSKGMVYRRLQNDDLARKCYEVAMLLYQKKHAGDPKNTDYIKGYAESLSLLGYPDKAMKVLDEAAVRLPNEKNLLYFKEAIRRPNPLGFKNPPGQ